MRWPVGEESIDWKKLPNVIMDEVISDVVLVNGLLRIDIKIRRRQMNKNIELKPCPKCDGEILLYSNGPKRGVYAKCKACGSEYPIPVKIKT